MSKKYTNKMSNSTLKPTKKWTILAKKVAAWTESKEGQEAMLRAVAQAKEHIAELKKAQQINPAEMHIHFTI